MRVRARALLTRVDRLSIRERALLLIAAIAVVYGVFDLALFQPIEARQKRVATQTQEAVLKLQALEIQALELRGAADPAAEQRRQMSALEADITELDRRLRAITTALIPPETMVSVLEDLIQRRGTLTLTAIQSLAPQPFLREAQAETEAGAAGDATAQEGLGRPPVYRHGLELTFAGSYLAALDYVRALEALPWTIYWDRLELRVTEYPEVEVTIVMHTLSTREGWIGV